MHRSKIEWVLNPDNKTLGWVWNPVTGCLNGCSYCYARKLANGRLKSRYLTNKNILSGYTLARGVLKEDAIPPNLDPFYPRFWEDRLIEPIRGYHKADWLGVTPDAASEKGIFVCDMSDLFGIGIPQKWTQRVMDTIKMCPQDRFYLLTKQPQNLISFFKNGFPDNCWVGVTATGYKMFNEALDYLKAIEAKVKYISVEPMLEAIPFYMERLAYCGINWIIIGSQTRPTIMPKIGCVEHIVQACDKAGIPVFLKDNLRKAIAFTEDNSFMFQFIPGVPTGFKLRQEMPK